MKEYINPSKAYESPIWCYAMIWAAMDRWGEDFFDQTEGSYIKYYEDFVRFIWGRGEIDEFVTGKLLAIDPDYVDIEWTLVKDLDRAHWESIEEKVHFKIYQLFAKFMSLDEHRAQIIEHIIEDTDEWEDNNVWDDFCNPRDNDENKSQIILLANNILEYEEYEEMSLMDIIYGTRRGEI